MRRLVLVIILNMFLMIGTANASGNGKTFLVHAKTSLKIDDAQICAVPNVAWTAFKKGYEVSILFDASGVTAIKKGGVFGGDQTPLDKADLPERERKSLSEQLGVALETVPRNYGEYIHFLKEKGIKLYANRTMMLLYKISEEKIDQAVAPIDLEGMVRLFEEADAYASY